MDGGSDYKPLNSLNYQSGIDVSSPILSSVSANALSDGSWNSILSGLGFTRPWSGATTQGSGTGAIKLMPFGNSWGGIASYGYSDKTFSAPSAVGTNQVTITAATDYVTGLACTVSTPGTLPTGLTALTIYYLIVVDSTHVKFATTVANALLGTATSITTGTGSGTITIDVSNASVVGSGNWFQDLGMSRWGIGSGQPMIAGVRVPGFSLSTNLQLQIASNGVYAAPVQAGLAQPSAPEVGIIDTSGTVTNSISAQIERTRPSTGANSVASSNSAVIVPQANRVRVTFPIAQTGQEAWRVFFTFMGFGGTGVGYLATYNGVQDIPESLVAVSSVGGSASTATGTLTFTANPANGETVVINGATITFSTTPTAGQVQIGATSTITAANLVLVLAVSADPLINVAVYTSSGAVMTITYGVSGTAGNAYTLATSTNITRSGATLTGGAAGDFSRSLEFDWQDGDLLPIEASFDDYPPPAATHAIRLNTVMTLAGCYSDSTTGPTSTNPGTCIAISKENNYESYIPTSLLYLTEQVTDVLARPLDDFGYIAGANSVSAIQYIGDRGDDLPSCTITTILPDIGIQYPHNWCQFRGQLALYTAPGNLMMMDQSGDFDTSFASPVSKILKGFTTAATALGYDQKNDSLVVMNGKRMLVYSRQANQWRQIWLPDYSLTGTTVSCTTANRTLYFTLNSSSVNTAYTYDTGSATAPLSFVSNYQNAGGVVVNDLYEMAIAAQTNVSTRLAVVINRNLTQTTFRQIQTTNTVANVTDSDSGFTSNMTGKSFILFGTNVGGGGTVLLQGTLTYVSASTVTLSVAPSATLTDCLMFVGNYAASAAISSSTHLPNFFPNLVELRSYCCALWLQSSGDVGNVNTVDLIGSAYASSRSQ